VTPRIDLINDSATERTTRDQLVELFERHDLSPFEFTEVVRIEDGAVPHSHPVLTLSTRSPNESALLSTYLHEQLHWFSSGCASPDGEAELFRRYPDEEIGTYIHLHVCWLELDALARYMPRDEVQRFLLSKPYYQDIYRRVVDDDAALGEMYRRYGMVPTERRLDYTILVVDDIDRAVAFYQDVVGFPLQHRSGPYAQFATGATRFAVYQRDAMAETLGIDHPPAFEIGCKVRDVDAAFAELVSRGAMPAVEPTDRPWGQRTAYVRDPDGHYIELAQDLTPSVGAESLETTH
jgi:catechol 2,3-dioxygenase-like lactoylglutathione lyase family enzyme